MTTVKDTAAAFVYKQNPERFDIDKTPLYIRPGANHGCVAFTNAA